MGVLPIRMKIRDICEYKSAATFALDVLKKF